MKPTFAVASFALIATLSGLSTAHATGFNDQSVIPSIAVSTQAGQQDLSRIPVVHGFNQRSHHADTVRYAPASPERTALAVGTGCDLTPRLGFNESSSFSNC